MVANNTISLCTTELQDILRLSDHCRKLFGNLLTKISRAIIFIDGQYDWTLFEQDVRKFKRWFFEGGGGGEIKINRILSSRHRYDKKGKQ